MESVGVRELRQNLSRYLMEVKGGNSLRVTERGREVARLIPSGPTDSPIARLVAERGATMPTANLIELARASPQRPAGGPSSRELLDAEREERL
jgi:prevent-host-death family protein